MCDLMGDFDAFTTRYRKLIAYYKVHFAQLEIDEEAELAQLKVHAK